MHDRCEPAPAVEALTTDSRRRIRAAILDEISGRPERPTRRHAALISGAAVALVMLGTTAVIGTGVLHDQSSPVPLAAAAGQIPVSTAECSPGASTTDLGAFPGAAYLLRSPTALPLTDVHMTVDDCSGATPVAVFYRADGSADDAALTIWSGDAQSPLGPLESFENAERVPLAPGAPGAWLVDLGWGVWLEGQTLEGQTKSGSYVITAAGLDRDTVVSVARSYQEEATAEAAGLALPDLESVAPSRASGRDATWYAQYGRSVPTKKDGEPWIQIHVSLSETPWAARASVNPIPTDGLAVPTRTGTAPRSGDNGGFRYATWTTETGARVQLTANLPEAEILELATRLELVGPHDPRLDRFDLAGPGADGDLRQGRGHTPAR